MTHVGHWWAWCQLSDPWVQWTTSLFLREEHKWKTGTAWPRAVRERRPSLGWSLYVQAAVTHPPPWAPQEMTSWFKLGSQEAGFPPKHFLVHMPLVPVEKGAFGCWEPPGHALCRAAFKCVRSDPTLRHSKDGQKNSILMAPFIKSFFKGKEIFQCLKDYSPPLHPSDMHGAC